MPKSPPPRLANPLVVVVAYDGLCMFEFSVAVEMFGLPRPEMGSHWYRFAVAGIDPGIMHATGGIRVMVDGDATLIAKAGTVVIPGWPSIDTPVPPKLTRAIRQAHDNGARVISICSGAFVLAEAGLLAGKRATAHWRYTDALKRRFPDIDVVPEALYVDEGTVLTSAGSAAAIDLCLHVIRRDFGSRVANTVARRLVVPPHRDGGQAQYIEWSVPTADTQDSLRPLLDQLRVNIATDYSVATLARMARMSERTFLRRFDAAVGTTPARWLHAERLSRVRILLEDTDLSIEKIAQMVGFGTATTLRHHFRRKFSTTPAAYRAVFGS